MPPMNSRRIPNATVDRLPVYHRILADLQETGTKTVSSERLAERKVSLPRTFTMITIAVNLVLLLIALAFVSLLLHAWTFTKNPDQSLRDLTSAATPAEPEK